MIKMKKTQISFEFMMIFTIILFFFISLAYFLPVILDKSMSKKRAAELFADEVKLNVITASLSESDYATKIYLEPILGDTLVSHSFYENPDNIFMIKDNHNDDQLAMVFLPIIDNVDTTITSNYVVINKTNNVLEIKFVN